MILSFLVAACAPASVPAPTAPAEAVGAPKPEGTAGLYEAARKEGALVVYGSGDASSWEPIRKAFMQRYAGIDVQVSAQRGRETREKIIAEQKAGRVIADIVSAGPDTTTALMEAGFLQQYRSPQLEHIRPEFQDPRGILSPRNINVYGIAINTRVVPPETAPKRWADLVDPKYRKKIAMQDPRGSGGGMTVLTALLKVHGEEFIRKLAEQDIFIGSNNAELRTQLVRGEHGLMLTDTLDSVMEEASKGAPLRFILPEEGVAVTPISVTMVKNAPHPNAARLFVDWILSEEGQKVIAERGDVPSRRGVPVKYPEANLDAVKILPRDDLEASPARSAELTKLWERIFFKKS